MSAIDTQTRQPEQLGDVIKSYSALDTADLHPVWQRPLVNLLDRLNSGEGIDATPFERELYGGWAACEISDIAERSCLISEPLVFCQHAIRKWQDALRHSTEEPRATIMALYGALELTDLNEQILRHRLAENEVNIQQARIGLGQLALHSYDFDSSGRINHVTPEDLKREAIELLFASLVLDYNEQNPDIRLVPLPATPRQRVSSHPARPNQPDSLDTSRTFTLRNYSEQWLPEGSAPVKVQSRFDERDERVFDLSKVTLIYGDAQLGIGSPYEAIAMARTLASPSPRREPEQAKRIEVAQDNILFELGY